ncbi:hypothetical protein SRIMHP_05250 [Streptomyces rimosus subsp. rimosus]|uniref:Uncharacterized protein n=1 Tax=Streptomyces rimosus subsp. rimosus TaxID=132474 RepID=A0ABY3ZDA3_STRRM|nr:hypothetical protein SRIMR7_37125 [Streptomyces rimosus subsp. rimosus]UTH93524.1 hypothetical protein SRIMHP_05250 [Streptomyces rimosus subsp. rimosus]UTJ11619.1 hypothetical protein SRIMDV3_05145 [Streptomyces rimosus subsp. rimosus]
MVAACRHVARLRARPTVAVRPVVSMVRMVRSPREHKQSCLLLRQMREGRRAGDRALTSPWRTRSPGAARCAELARELAAASTRSPPCRRTRHRHRGGPGPGDAGHPRHAGQGRRLPPRHRAGGRRARSARSGGSRAARSGLYPARHRSPDRALPAPRPLPTARRRPGRAHGPGPGQGPPRVREPDQHPRADRIVLVLTGAPVRQLLTPGGEPAPARPRPPGRGEPAHRRHRFHRRTLRRTRRTARGRPHPPPGPVQRPPPPPRRGPDHRTGGLRTEHVRDGRIARAEEVPAQLR